MLLNRKREGEKIINRYIIEIVVERRKWGGRKVNGGNIEYIKKYRR
jgi:hypothetical protein